MAGELCSVRSCGWCGRCDAEPDDRCDCGRAGCRGDCTDPTETRQVACRSSALVPGSAGVCGVGGVLHPLRSLHVQAQGEAGTSTTYDLDDIDQIDDHASLEAAR
jgi:hypothetical protein